MDNKISLSEINPDQDLDLLQTWFRTPEVERWWGPAERSLAEVQTPPQGGNHALILVNEIPVGYVRWQVPTRKELEEAGLQDLPEGTIDIDIAIGDLNYVGQGVGSTVLTMLVQTLFAQDETPMIIVCTDPENARALRAYEKVGFQRLRQFQDPESGTMWLLGISPKD